MDVIDSIEQLRARARLPAVLRFLGAVPDVEFALPAFTATDNRIATERLTNYRRACGCFAGGLLMSLATLGFIGSWAVSSRSFTDLGLADLLLFVALFFVSTWTGKSLGILWARTRAIQLVRRLVVTANR
jgi:hypothetical protein